MQKTFFVGFFFRGLREDVVVLVNNIHHFHGSIHKALAQFLGKRKPPGAAMTRILLLRVFDINPGGFTALESNFLTSVSGCFVLVSFLQLFQG